MRVRLAWSLFEENGIDQCCIRVDFFGLVVNKAVPQQKDAFTFFGKLGEARLDDMRIRSINLAAVRILQCRARPAFQSRSIVFSVDFLRFLLEPSKSKGYAC